MVVNIASLNHNVYRPYFGSGLHFETWLTSSVALGTLLILLDLQLPHAKHKNNPIPRIKWANGKWQKL